MDRRTVTALSLLVLVLSTVLSTMSGSARVQPAQASALQQTCTPATPTAGPTMTPVPSSVDPALLRLPASALPPGAHVDHDGISDNPDADGRTTPPDCTTANIHSIHQNFYEVLGRITGYRMDFTYQIQGAAAGTEYLASVFPDPAHAQAAMDDSNGLLSLIGTSFPQQCTAGDLCKAYYGANPLNPTQEAVFAKFVRGPILVETGSAVPSASFSQLQAAMQAQLYAILNAADAQAQLALSGGGKPSSTATATLAPPTVTPVPPTNTPTPKPTAKPKKTKTKKKLTCKKGYKIVKGKCKKVKKKHG